MNDLLDADTPIPLGRPATEAAAGPETQPVAELAAGPSVLDAVVEPPLAPMPAAVAVEMVPAMAPTMPAVALSPETPPIAGQAPAEPPTQQDVHPLAGLRGFRLEPIPVETLGGGRRDLVRFLVCFALVMAFVYALIVAFVLLVAHLRGTPA